MNLAKTLLNIPEYRKHLEEDGYINMHDDNIGSLLNVPEYRKQLEKLGFVNTNEYAIEMARKMLKHDILLADISECTGLSMTEVKQLQQEIVQEEGQ